MTDTFPNQRIVDSIQQAYKSIGYQSNLLKRHYAYTDFLSTSPTSRNVDLAVFGQEPLDYRSACFAHLIVDNGYHTDQIANQLRSFGAPQFYIILRNQTQIWINKENNAVLKDTISTDRLPSLIKSKKKEWQPSEILRQKSSFAAPTDNQIDFIDIGLLPALEHEASKKIDSLIRSILHRIEPELPKHGRTLS